MSFDFTPFDELLRGHTGTPEEARADATAEAESLHARWHRGQALFEERDYRGAAIVLSALVADLEALQGPEVESRVSHGLADVRLLLARAYYHSAQLDHAIVAAEQVLAESPDDAYAHLLIGRALQRSGRGEQADGHLKLAELLGDYTL
ncbi:tetratricopeptide repeat protein [Arsenicicoccus piscis]|nr:tetratricopeptide repeat protein [Arsenicicoccus piscis]